MKFILVFSLILSIGIIPALPIDDADGMKKQGKYDPNSSCHMSNYYKLCKENQRFQLEQRLQNCIDRYGEDSFHPVLNPESENCRGYIGFAKGVDFHIMDGTRNIENSRMLFEHVEQKRYTVDPETYKVTTTSERVQVPIGADTFRKMMAGSGDGYNIISGVGSPTYVYYPEYLYEKFRPSLQNIDPVQNLAWDEKTKGWVGQGQDLAWDSYNQKWVERSLLNTEKSTGIAEIKTESSSFDENQIQKYEKMRLENEKQKQKYEKQIQEWKLANQEREKQKNQDLIKSIELDYEKNHKPSVPWWCFWC